MSVKMRRVMEDMEANVMEGRAKTASYQEASAMRTKFLKENIINFNTNFYKTQDERDWSYVCRREYNYAVVLKSVFYAGFAANLVMSQRIFARKRMVWWPLAVVGIPAYFYFHQRFLFAVNKRLFDMCNVGEEFELGQMRNIILRQCNAIQDVEDF